MSGAPQSAAASSLPWRDRPARPIVCWDHRKIHPATQYIPTGFPSHFSHSVLALEVASKIEETRAKNQTDATQ